MAEPEERLGEGEGGKVRDEEEEERARVRLDNEVKERRMSEEARIRGREEELRGRESSQAAPRGGLDSSQPSRGGLDFTRGLISLKQMQEHSFSLVNQVKPQLTYKYFKPAKIHNCNFQSHHPNTEYANQNGNCTIPNSPKKHLKY